MMRWRAWGRGSIISGDAGSFAEQAAGAGVHGEADGGAVVEAGTAPDVAVAMEAGDAAVAALDEHRGDLLAVVAGGGGQGEEADGGGEEDGAHEGDSAKVWRQDRPHRLSFYQWTRRFYQDSVRARTACGRDSVRMTHQLNIKAEETYRLAVALAQLTGESLTAAVTEALRERLERERQKQDAAALKRRLTHLAAASRGSTRRRLARADLYDERGLPR